MPSSPSSTRLADEPNRSWQLARPDRPAARDENTPDPEHHCLIIYENVESLEYIEKPQRETGAGYRFFPIPYLREEVSILPHQQEGIAWWQILHDRVPGVLMADDMGLGKTFQALSFLSGNHSEHNPENHPSLIVAPEALLENWMEEINQFFHPFARSVNLSILHALRDISGQGNIIRTSPGFRPDRWMPGQPLNN